MKIVHLILGSTREVRIKFSKINGYQPISYVCEEKTKNKVNLKKNLQLTLDNSINKESDVYIEIENITNESYEQIISICKTHQAKMEVYFMMEVDSFNTEIHNENEFKKLLELHKDKINFSFFPRE